MTNTMTTAGSVSVATLMTMWISAKRVDDTTSTINDFNPPTVPDRPSPGGALYERR